MKSMIDAIRDIKGRGDIFWNKLKEKKKKVIESIGWTVNFGKIEGRFFSETMSSIVLIITKSNDFFFFMTWTLLC